MSSTTDKVSAKEIVAALLILILIGAGVYFSLGIFASESEQKEVVIADASKVENHVEVYVKLLTIDTIKGDATVRMELIPHGNVIDEDGGLSSGLRFYIPSANGKTEIEFKKGQSLAPVEAVLSMYGGNAADYPFDSHKAGFYALMEKLEVPSAPKPAATPAVEEEGETPAATPKPAEPELGYVPLDVSFFGSIPGYKIGAAKSKDLEEGLVAFDIEIARSNTIVGFSMFVVALMWGLSIAVLFLFLSVLLRGRKPELGMFSFMAALLFAFYAVRNSQPNVPPIGVFSDFVSFFWAEALVALCLLLTVFVWVFRSTKT